MGKIYCLQYVGGKCLIGHTDNFEHDDAQIKLSHACFLTMAEMQDRSRSLIFSFAKAGTRNQDVIVNVAGNNTLLTAPYEPDPSVARVYSDFIESGLFDAATECVTNECGPIAVQEDERRGVLHLIRTEDKVH